MTEYRIIQEILVFTPFPSKIVDYLAYEANTQINTHLNDSQDFDSVLYSALVTRLPVLNADFRSLLDQKDKLVKSSNRTLSILHSPLYSLVADAALSNNLT